MIDSSYFWLLLGSGVIAQMWAVLVFFRDSRFDALTRFGYAAVVLMCPILGFFMVLRHRQRVLDSRMEQQRATEARLRGSLRRRL